MFGSLLQAAKQDAARFASDTGGFAVTATLSKPDSTNPLVVTGLGTGTWMVFEDLRNGKPVNSISNSFNIPEVQLIAAAYPYKNTGGAISLVKHKITITDPNGVVGNYEVTEQHPNATLGLIVLILGRQG